RNTHIALAQQIKANTIQNPHTQFLTGLVAVLLAICSVVLLAGCLCCQRNNGFKEFRDSPVASSTTIIGSNQDHGHVNPIANSSSEFTIFTPISPPHHNNNVFLANQRIVSCSQEEYKDGDIDASLWFDGSEKDFPRTKLKYIRELGKGWFGRVVEGTAQNISEDPGDSEWTPVVVRILEASATSRERLLFLNDAAIYKCGYHPHILRILGRSLDTVPLLLLQEYCSQGDLKKYLRMCKSSQDKLVAEEMPLRWCYQLTLALKFLHDQKLTHPDLAARNCQVSEDLSLKLGDYGLSASYYPEDYYQGSPGVPLRWCAPEIIAYTSTTIQTTPTTVESNIWALGVTMWEMLEWGEQPYSDLTDDEVISHVLGTAKIRLTRPTYRLIYTDYMYKIMQSCWYNTESRITVSQIELMVTDLMHVYENTKISLDLNSDIPHEGEPISLEEFDMRWNALKPNSPLARDSDVLEQLQQNQSREKQDRAQKSASMNNLHGSLDNLLDTRQFDQMESWLENVASDVSDMSFVRGLSEAITDLDNAIAMQNISSSPEFGKANVTVGGQFTSSESETEDENWRKKIERGAYTEKVRQKSRSVADLMVLTHIDYSESDSETLPSLDYSKANQRVRYLKSVDNQKKFGSEGNLIHVHDNTFQEELKKLQEERRDSLLFVPDKFSECSFSEERAAAAATSTMSSSLSNNRLDNLENSPVKKLIEKLNSPSEMVPPQQVYNVFNVRVQHMNVSGTVCDKIGETVDRNVNAISRDSAEKEENAFSAICDRQLESKVLEHNMLILPSSDNQNKSFSVDNSENQNIEHRECPSHITPFYNAFVNAENSTNSSYDGCIKKVEGQSVIFSRNCIQEETYPCKKVSNGTLDSAYVINSTNGKNNEIISTIFENAPYGKVKEEKPMISNAPTSPNQYNSNILQRKELSTETDTMKQNNFEVKIEILNEQNSTLNTHKNYNIMPNNLNNEISSSKEILATSKENSKNVKLKVPKLSEIIQRNAIDYKVHHHHTGSNDKTSVISKNEENEKLIHQDIVDKDSGLNTPENSASLEKLYDDNEEILDIGSFDSDRSNETNTNKGILLTELSNEEEHNSKGKSDEVPLLGYFREETKEIGEEDEISKMIDYCVKKEAKLVCDLFLAHERSNYFADANDTLVMDSKAAELDSEVNKKSVPYENISNVIKKYSFLSYDYKNDMRNFIESEVYHTSTLLDYAVLPSKLDNDIMQDVDVNTNALLTKADGCKYDRNSAIEDVVLSNQQLLNNKTSKNQSVISYTGSKAVSLNEETHNSSRTDDKVPDEFDFIQARNFSQQENLESTSGNELLDKDKQTIENETEGKSITFDERLKPAFTGFEKLDNNHTVEEDPYKNLGTTIYEVLSVQPDTTVNNLPDLIEIKDCQVQSTALENQINAKTVDQLFNKNDSNDGDINRRYNFDIVKIIENFNLAALEKELRSEPVILEKLIAKFDSNEENGNTTLDDEESYIQENLTIIDKIPNCGSAVNEEKNQGFMSKPDENVEENEAICEGAEISQTRSFLNNEIECSSMYPIITNTVTYTNNPENTILESIKTYEEVTISNTPNKLQEFTFKDILTDKEDINSKEENITEVSVLNDSAERIVEVTENVQHSTSTMQQNDLRNTTDAVVQLDFNTNCDLNLSGCTQFEFIEDEQLLPHTSKKEELAAQNSKTNACNFDQPSAILIDEVMNENDVTLKILPKLHEQPLLEEHDDIVNKKTSPQIAGLDTENDANVVVRNIDYIDKTDVSSENAFAITVDESEQNIQELNTGQSNTATPLCPVNKLQGDIFESNNTQLSKVPSLVSYATIVQTAIFLNMEISSYSKVDGDLTICSSVQPSSEFDEVRTISGENKVDHSLYSTQSTTFPILGSEVVSEIQELPVVAQEEFQSPRDC
ncbi:protein kinase, partial [Oryctes borbonicus]